MVIAGAPSMAKRSETRLSSPQSPATKDSQADKSDTQQRQCTRLGHLVWGRHLVKAISLRVSRVARCKGPNIPGLSISAWAKGANVRSEEINRGIPVFFIVQRGNEIVGIEQAI